MKKFLSKFDQKKLKIGFRFIGAGFALAFLLYITPIAFSRYETTATSNANVDLAFYLLDDNYYTNNIKLLDLTPRSEPYTFTFSVSNYNSSRAADTNIEYDLTLRTTTNIPLNYELYLNGDYTTNLITSDNTVADDDGTYFRTLTTEKKILYYTTNTRNLYTLYVYFPAEYNGAEYSNLIEYVEINVDSKQVTNDSTTTTIPIE